MKGSKTEARKWRSWCKYGGCRHPKRKPYGTKGTDPYCSPHDQCMVYSVSKKSERQKAKKKIKDESSEDS